MTRLTLATSLPLTNLKFRSTVSAKMTLEVMTTAEDADVVAIKETGATVAKVVVEAVEVVAKEMAMLVADATRTTADPGTCRMAMTARL